MFDKTKIFNLALGALQIQKTISNADTDPSKEVLTLNVFWDLAYQTALEDMDLDSTSSRKTLELLKTEPNEFWRYAYKYPTDCAFLRRIVSGTVTDDQFTREDMRVEMFEGDKVIMCNRREAEIEYIAKDFPVDSLTPQAAYYVSLLLARLSLPLVAGTNKKAITDEIKDNLTMALLGAQARDGKETSIYQPDYMKSEFVKARLS